MITNRIIQFFATVMLCLCLWLIGCGGGSGGAQLPTIVSQPVSQTVAEGKTVTFMVTASGDAPLSYQWRRNGADVAGGTQSQYSFVAQLGDRDTLWSVAVGSATSGVTVSQAAKLTVSQADISLLFGNVAYAGSSSRQRLVSDKVGNLFVADRSAVVKIEPNGAATMLAGSWTQHGTSDGTGATALFGSLGGVAIDSTGQLYVAEQQWGTYDLTIRKITAKGLVTTFGSWNTAQLKAATSFLNPYLVEFQPDQLAVDLNGNFFVSMRAIGSSGSKLGWEVIKISSAGVLSRISPEARGVAKSATGTLFSDDQSNIHVMSCNDSESSYILIDASGAIHNKPLVSGKCLTALAMNKSRVLYAAQLTTWQEPVLGGFTSQSAYQIGTLSSKGEFSEFAGSLSATYSSDVVLGDFPGGLGTVNAMTFGPDGMLYVLANNAVLRIRVP